MKQKKEKKEKQKKLRVMHVGKNRALIYCLWVLLIGSVVFGIYKNFTAIDQHTIHEKEVIEKRVVDTNKIESFVDNFVTVYYSWEQSEASIEKRSENIGNYLTEDLKSLNVDTIQTDIPTSSSVQSVQIWDVQMIDDNNYDVLFSVDQMISESKTVTVKKKSKIEIVQSSYTSSYSVKVYVDDSGNMVIIQNPTIGSLPEKSDYVAASMESDGTVDANTSEEITEFLTTFFALYPAASEKELSYYVKNNALEAVGQEYTFVELVRPVYRKENKQVSASVSVKYLDPRTKSTQVSQFELTLEKEESGNWVIIK